MRFLRLGLGTILFSFLLLMGTGVVHAQPIEPDGSIRIIVPGVQQEKSLWCWAACIESNLRSKGIKISQTDIVTTVFGKPINKAADLGEVWSAYFIQGYNSTQYKRPLSAEKAASEIGDYLRPFNAGLTNGNGTGHMVLVNRTIVEDYGDLSTLELGYMNPTDGDFHTKTYDEFRNGAKFSWSETVYEIRER